MAGLFDNGIYVHYRPSAIDNYKDVKQNILKNYEGQNLSNLMAKNLSKTNSYTEEEKNAFFDFLGGFGEGKGELEALLNQNLNGLNNQLLSLQSGFGQFNNFYEAVQAIKSDPSVANYNAINGQIKRLLGQMEPVITDVSETIIQDDIKQAIASGVFQISNYNNNLQKNSQTGLTLSQQLLNIYKEAQNAAIIYKDTSSEFAKKTYGTLRALIGLSKMLDQYTGAGGAMAKVDNQLLNKYIDYFCYTYPIVMGFAFQGILADYPEIVTDNLLVKFTETGQGSAKLKYQGKQDSAIPSGSVTRTQDLSIDVLFDKNTPEKLKLSATFHIPGASVKYSSGVLNGAKKSVINIKANKPNLGHLLHDLDNKSLSAIYNIFGAYKHTKALKKTGRKIEKNPIDRRVYSEMWGGLRVGLAINGLIGQMTKDDFAYYFIINGDIYTVPDIIRQLLEDSKDKTDPTKVLTKFGLEMASVPTITAQSKLQDGFANDYNKWEEGEDSPKALAQKRSDRLIAEVQAAKVSAGVKLRVLNLSKFSNTSP